MARRKQWGVFLFFVATTLVLSSCGGALTADNRPPTPTPSPTATPVASPTPTPDTAIKHVVVLVLQNSSFDHMFGTFTSDGNTVEGIREGVPGYTQKDSSGKDVSPFLLTDLSPPALPEGRAKYTEAMNGGLMDKYALVEGRLSMGYYDGSTAGISTLWNYAREYALADKYFASVIGEAPTNQLYMVAASNDDFPFSFQPFYGPCQLPDSASRPLTFPNLGDQLTEAGVTWAAYQQSLGQCSAMSALHNPFQYFTSTQNGPNIRDYSEFAVDLSTGNFPAVSFVFPDSSNDMHPGHGPVTGGAALADTIVKEIQATDLWANTVILVTFDTGGGWYDHVAPPTVDSQGLASRVPLIVISPLTKQRYVSHVQLDHVSILRFIQQNWGLASLNTRNTQSNDLSDFFR